MKNILQRFFIGILEAVECVPTFGTKPSQIIGLIAGGKKAVFRSQEGAEDNEKHYNRSSQHFTWYQVRGCTRRQHKQESSILSFSHRQISFHALGGLSTTQDLKVQNGISYLR